MWSAAPGNGHREAGRLPRVKNLARTWDQAERPFAANAYDGRGTSEVDYQPSRSKLLVTAPHAVNHHRHARPKLADRWTGGLATLTGQALGAAVLIASSRVPDWTAWAERTDDFARALRSEVAAGAVVIDVHGMSDTHGVDICIGTGTAPTALSTDLAALIEAKLEAYQVGINEPFAARAPYTVVDYVSGLGGRGALQIEVAARLRNPSEHPSEAETFASLFLEALRASIELLDESRR